MQITTPAAAWLAAAVLAVLPLASTRHWGRTLGLAAAMLVFPALEVRTLEPARVP